MKKTRIINVPSGATIQCCGATAEVLSTGFMGTRVMVKKLPEDSGLCIGHQIWSNETIVEVDEKFIEPLILFK